MMYFSEVEDQKMIRKQSVETGYTKEAVEIGAETNKCLSLSWRRKE